MSSYKLLPVFKIKNIKKYYLIDALIGIFFVLVWTGMFFMQTRMLWVYLIGALFFLSVFGVHFITDDEAKKPLVYTKRAVRLNAVTALIPAIYTIILSAIFTANGVDGYFKYLIYFSYPVLFIPFFAIAHFIITPFENLNNFRYEKRAEKILKSYKNLVKIAITGSYGKTSVKNYLTHMLKENFVTLATKESYNTPMGISKSVNELTARYQVFIAEMGARKTGDIKKLMKIVKPDHGILTGIAPQHLETFKTIDNIVKEKRLVLDMLDDNAVKVANGECEFISLQGNIKYCGFENVCDYFADEICCSKEGSTFCLHLKGEDIFCSTKLLGKHNILNIVMAAAMAFELKVPSEKIAEAISSLKPVPHRLELIKGEGVTVIDDSFNSSVSSSRAALDTLSMFEGRKVVLTPGLIELGKAEYKANFELGAYMANIVDYAILIGEKRSLPLIEGLKSGGFNEENISIFNSLNEAKAKFNRLLCLNDNLLILNDLPDNYDE